MDAGAMNDSQSWGVLDAQFLLQAVSNQTTLLSSVTLQWIAFSPKLHQVRPTYFEALSTSGI